MHFAGILGLMLPISFEVIILTIKADTSVYWAHWLSLLRMLYAYVQWCRSANHSESASDLSVMYAVSGVARCHGDQEKMVCKLVLGLIMFHTCAFITGV